ncbi:hypothetical protein Tco_0206236 [Tanacetum coccineum]
MKYNNSNYFYQPQEPSHQQPYHDQEQNIDEKIDRNLKWVDEQIQEMKQRMNNSSIRQEETSSLIQHVDEVIHSLRQGNNHQVINENTTHQVSHWEDRINIMDTEECSNTNIMYSDFESHIDIGDYREEWNINVSPFEEPLHIPVSCQVGEDVVDSTTTYHPTNSQELIFSPIMDTKSQDHEDFFKDIEVTYTDLNPPQVPQVVINQVGEDDLNFKDVKEEEKVSLVEEEHYVVERYHETSLSTLTHIIVKEVHRKARVRVRELRHSLCHGKRKFQEVSTSTKLVNVARKTPREKHVRIASNRRKRKKSVRVSKHRHFSHVREGGVLEVLTNGNVTWTRRT